MDCLLTITSGAVQYLQSGENHLGELDAVTPGISAAYNEAMYGVVPQLASFKSQDDARARTELIPYTERFRAACHKLAPGAPS